MIRIFKESRNNYGSRKIKVELRKLGYQVSLRKIRTIMKLHGLVSNYTVKQFKVHRSKCNEENVDNIVNREFNREKRLEVVVSDLTYVNVAVNKKRPVFPTDQALLKTLYLATINVSKKWTGRIRGWDMIYNQLSIIYEGRI